MNWLFLLAGILALSVFAAFVGVLVVLIRAAMRSTGRAPGEVRCDESGNMMVPPMIVDDSLTNPTNPLYHLHHPTSMPDDSSRHHSIDLGPSPSFDSGSSSASSDSGGSGCG